MNIPRCVRSPQLQQRLSVVCISGRRCRILFPSRIGGKHSRYLGSPPDTGGGAPERAFAESAGRGEVSGMVRGVVGFDGGALCFPLFLESRGRTDGDLLMTELQYRIQIHVTANRLASLLVCRRKTAKGW